MATIGQIADNESGSSVRTKLNLSIDEVNKVIDKAAKVIGKNTKAVNYTLLATDNGLTIKCSAALTITMPDGLPDGFNCWVEKIGTGDVAFAADTSYESSDSYDSITTQFSRVQIIHGGSNAFTLYGAEPAAAVAPLIIPLKQLGATGSQTLTVTAGYSISEIAVVYADISGTAVISIGTSVSGQQIMKRKEFNASTPYAHVTRGFMPQAGISSNWTIHLTTATSLVNVYIKTSKLIS